MTRRRSVGVVVAREVAAREGVEPSELPEPLHRVVDVEALNRLIASGAVRVSFRYLGYDVTVDDTGSVDLTPAPGPD
jgi:hypothetical protein